MALLVLTGCSPAATGTPTGSATPSATASAPASATPTPTPTPEPTGTPIALTCDQLLTAQEAYDFNPNYGTAPAYEPSSGSLAATAVKYSGLACAWSNQTSGELIEIAVAQPEAALMTTLEDKAIADSQVVPTYSSSPEIKGYFTMEAASGQVQVFTDTYWLTLSSPAFYEPGDAQTLVAAVLAHLG
nr:iron ABC transporter ATP-binding protein [Cryobacterium roopkundense]